MRGPMRVATLLLCLSLAACAGGKLPGEQPAPGSAGALGATGAPGPAAGSPDAASSSAAASAPAAPAAPAPSPSAGRTAPAAAAAPAGPPLSDAERLRQARVACWVKVEEQKRLRDIDRRIAFVEKCVNEATKQR